MPYLFATFEDDVDASMRNTATHIAASSAFQPHRERFHVPLLGSLHGYSADGVAAAMHAAPTLRGRFVAWKVEESQLRAMIEFDDDATMTLHQLKAGLPRGTPWRVPHVSLGSVATIDPARHEAFRVAVREAFPIDSGVVFRTGSFGFRDDGAHATEGQGAHEDTETQEKSKVEQQIATMADHKMKAAKAAPAAKAALAGKAAPAAKAAPAGKAAPANPPRSTRINETKLNPLAAPFTPAGKPTSNRTKPSRRRRRHSKSGPATSPHRKWLREQHHTDPATGSTTSAIDALIKTASTGTAAGPNRRAMHSARLRAASRAAAVHKARQ